MSKNLGKPKIVADVLEKGGRNVFQKLPDPLGRSFGYHRHFPKIFQDILVLIVLIAFIALNTTLTSLAPVALSQESAAERQALEQELQRIEAEIDSYQNNIINLQAQAKTLNQSIQLLDAQINKLNLQIKATNLQLAKLDSQIDTLRVSVTKTQSSIDATQDMLVYALRQIYEEGQKSPLVVFLGENTLSDAFSAVNDLTSLESEIKRSLDELINLKANLIAQREDLANQRQEVLELKNIQEAQRKELEAKKKEKNNLMQVTKGQESKYQELLKKSQQTAAQIKSRIFTLLGGGEMSFEEAYKLAKFASEQTGVRASFLLAILDRESAFGRNVGKCNWKTAMHPTRDQPIFLKITQELGINPDSVSVSCANADGAYGGAMGPAQFIPSTWWLYKDKVAKITGNNPPSPWRNVDAFVAMALLLKDLGADKQTYAAEREAAARYYAGSRWRSYLYSYGQWVADKAQQFEADIRNSNLG
ncbi:MAG: lytic murein transglycosylase [Candidatus Pacebacteria bacterium]|nr:lytic murein transglycosylase [Candidatus Paceibacterota bacterium]